MSDIDYKKGKNNFPKDNIDPALKKKPQYCKQYAEAIYGSHISDQGGVRNLRQRDISLLKLYAEGRQPVEKYHDIVCPKDKKTGERKTYMDLSLDPISVIPKFRSIVVGKFLEKQLDVIADAVDEMSGDARRLMKHKLWAKAELSRALEPFQDLISNGVEFSQAQSIIPSTVEELNMIESAGGFKMRHETGIEMLLKDAFNISNWEVIKQTLYENIFDTGMIATKTYTCPETGKAKVRAVDMEDLVVRYSKHKLHDNIDYAGEMLSISPNQIRTQASADLSIEDIEGIIENNNNTTNYDYSYANTVDDFYNRHGNTNIKVLDVVWLTNDIIKQERRIDSRGDMQVNNVPFNYSKKSTEKRKILEGQKQMVYKCKWVVGTNFVYDYGVDEDIMRPTKKTAKLPYTIYKLTDKSMLESIIPHEDGINLAWLNFQNALSKAAPPGIAIDIDAITNVFDGKNKLTPKAVLQIKRETGDLLYSSTTHHNQPVSPNAGRPIYDLPGGVGAYLEEQIRTIDFNIKMIRDITGINEVVDASAPSPNALVQTSKMAEDSSNKVLYQMMFAYKTLKEQVANHLSYRIQTIIRYKDYKPYKKVIGSGMLEMFKQGSPIAESSYGITLKMKPGLDEKNSTMQKANEAYAKGMIRLSDIMKVEHIIEGGSVKQAQMYLAYKEKEYEKLQAQREQERIEAQNQAIMQQQQQATEGRMIEKKADAEIDKEKTANKAQNDIVEYEAKSETLKDQENNKSQNKIREELIKS